jgi:hypothetical protein
METQNPIEHVQHLRVLKREDQLALRGFQLFIWKLKCFFQLLGITLFNIKQVLDPY